MLMESKLATSNCTLNQPACRLRKVCKLKPLGSVAVQNRDAVVSEPKVCDVETLSAWYLVGLRAYGFRASGVRASGFGLRALGLGLRVFRV